MTASVPTLPTAPLSPDATNPNPIKNSSCHSFPQVEAAERELDFSPRIHHSGASKRTLSDRRDILANMDQRGLASDLWPVPWLFSDNYRLCVAEG